MWLTLKLDYRTEVLTTAVDRGPVNNIDGFSRVENLGPVLLAFRYSFSFVVSIELQYYALWWDRGNQTTPSVGTPIDRALSAKLRLSLSGY